MKFIDECTVDISAGKGGDGIVSFRREARVARGGPDGGDGGNGGSVYFVGETGMNTLINLKLKRVIRGNDGENGRSKNQYGANGDDIYVKVPLGTMVYDGERLVADITEAKEYLIAKGGVGGKGNTRFKSSRNTAPRLSENGLPGEVFRSRLSLKVLADVGLVGKPSAGKSTLLSMISNAKPKVADYDFTSLTPTLGLVESYGNSFVVADLPGLIKGAHGGKGLGIEFLKHIDRCRVIGHIIDFGDPEKDPIKDFEIILDELAQYSLGLDKRQNVVIANKKDLPAFEENLEKFKAKFPKIPVVEISAINRDNLEEAKKVLYDALQDSKPIEKDKKVTEVTIELEEDVIVENPYHGMFEVSGARVKRIYDKIPLNTSENFNRFNKMLKDAGVWKLLEDAGIKEGDTVAIFGYQFDWINER